MSTREKGSRGDVGRRDFLKLFGAAGAAAGTLPLGGSASAHEIMAAAATDAKHHHAAAEPHAGGPGYEFFNVDESAFVEAAVDALIPSDSTGPGAKELGVATYIDRQMASGYGKGDRLYLEGPFGEGTPEQGYQLAMTPSELNGVVGRAAGTYPGYDYSTANKNSGLTWDEPTLATEPPRVCRRPFGLSYAAMSGSSSIA